MEQNSSRVFCCYFILGTIMIYTLQISNWLKDRIYILEFFPMITKSLPHSHTPFSTDSWRPRKIIRLEAKKSRFFLRLHHRLLSACKVLSSLLIVLICNMWTLPLTPLNSQPAERSTGFRDKRLNLESGFATNWQMTLGKSHMLPVNSPVKGA